jgi:hypothetical protein
MNILLYSNRNINMYYIILLALPFALFFFMRKIYSTKRREQFGYKPEPPSNIYSLAEYRERLIDAGVILDAGTDLKTDASRAYTKTPKDKTGKPPITSDNEED